MKKFYKNIIIIQITTGIPNGVMDIRHKIRHRIPFMSEPITNSISRICIRIWIWMNVK